MTRVEFVLKLNLDRKSCLIYIPEEARCLFPAYLNKINLKSNAGTDVIIVQGNPETKNHARPHLHLLTTDWFKKNKDSLKNGDKLIIEITESKQGKEYYLK